MYRVCLYELDTKLRGYHQDSSLQFTWAVFDTWLITHERYASICA